MAEGVPTNNQGGRRSGPFRLSGGTFKANAAACHGHGEDKLPDSCNVKFVADNVNHNINTIDGHCTFHGMGIIMSITPL